MTRWFWHNSILSSACDWTRFWAGEKLCCAAARPRKACPGYSGSLHPNCVLWSFVTQDSLLSSQMSVSPHSSLSSDVMMCQCPPDVVTCCRVTCNTRVSAQLPSSSWPRPHCLSFQQRLSLALPRSQHWARGPGNTSNSHCRLCSLCPARAGHCCQHGERELERRAVHDNESVTTDESIHVSITQSVGLSTDHLKLREDFVKAKMF